MSLAEKIVAGILAWVVIGFLVGGLIGRAIRYGDRREFEDEQDGRERVTKGSPFRRL